MHSTNTKDALLRSPIQAQNNPEKIIPQQEKIDKKPNLLKRVGRSLLKIVEAPLHVVGGALEATGYALQGRLDKSIQSIGGGLKRGFGSLHEGIRNVPLIGDVLQRVEKAAFGIHEKMDFKPEEKEEIMSAENRLKKAMEGLLDPLSNKTPEELMKEGEDLRKEIEEESKKEMQHPRFSEEVNNDSYKLFQKEVPGLPDFADLNQNQKNVLQQMYFGRSEEPDLKNPKVQEYIQKTVKAISHNASPSDKYEFIAYSIENTADIQDLFHYTPLERKTLQYAINTTERTKRIESNTATKEEIFTDNDYAFMGGMNQQVFRLFGNNAPGSNPSFVGN